MIMLTQLSILSLILLTVITTTLAQPKCDQTAGRVTYDIPSDNNGLFFMTLSTKGSESNADSFLPDQTYVLTLQTVNSSRTFRWFMITAEDPRIDNIDFQGKPADVGGLKSLDGRQSRHSERCLSTLENTDNTDKTSVEVHWVSPKPTSKTREVRIRATIGETDETWYTGENLTITLKKNVQKDKDSPPTDPRQVCNLCSEAQYEVIFHGRWSRLTHPQHYPSKPDENGYSHMIGASHALNYTLWKNGRLADEGVKELAQEGNITLIERNIILNMSIYDGTRTLIRGKRRHHPHMSEPSHSLLRVDRVHHLFSLMVGLRPSPDWFLGVSDFELCMENGWLAYHKMPLLPWDAGTMDGISYESKKSVTNPVNLIQRVSVGSFDKESPFFQLNLNDLQPFAILEIRRLNVFPLNIECENQEQEEEPKVQELVIHPFESAQESPIEIDDYASNADMNMEDCNEWSDWTPCVPYGGSCGPGVQSRSRYEASKSLYYDRNINNGDCQRDEDSKLTQTQQCYTNCVFD